MNTCLKDFNFKIKNPLESIDQSDEDEEKKTIMFLFPNPFFVVQQQQQQTPSITTR